MSDETVWRLKIGTVAAVLLGIMSLMGTGFSVWVNNISLKVNTHGESIARLEECQRNTAVTITTDGAKSISIGAGSMTLGIGSGTNQITILP